MLRQLTNPFAYLPINTELFSPEDAGSGAGADDSLETLELLNAEEPDEEPLNLSDKEDDAKSATSFEDRGDENDSKESEEDAEEELDEKEVEDELKEIEEELKGPSEEDLELTTPVRRREILKKYPNLFKDFPYLEKAYYREQQFTELLPTVQDAKIAVEKSRVLDKIEKDVMNGNIAEILTAAKAESQEAFLKIADNYLPALKQADQQAYFHVLGNVVKDTIITMVKEARNLGESGQPLQMAAQVLNQFVFGSSNFTNPEPLYKAPDPKTQTIEQQRKTEEQQQLRGKYETVKGELQTKADNVLKSTIDQHIDPKKSMTDYVRTNATRDAKENLEKLIGQDQRFMGLLDQLWEKAYQKGFDKESTDRIKSAYLSKAKTLLPSVIKKARYDALKGLGRTVRSSEKTEQTDKKGPITPGKSTAPVSGKSNFKKASDIPKGMSTLDVLNS